MGSVIPVSAARGEGDSRTPRLRELQELCARIERLRERLKQGDADMAADEIQAAIDRAETKRRELEEQGPAAKPSSRLFTMLPQAAEAYRRQITKGWQATRVPR